MIQILHRTLHLLFPTLPLLLYSFSFTIMVTSLMKIKLNAMKKIIFLFISFLVTLFTVHAQKAINFSHTYPAGGRLQICVDSSAKNVFYANKFPNQQNTSFNYLPEVNNIGIQIYFRKTDRVQDYRYTILADD